MGVALLLSTVQCDVGCKGMDGHAGMQGAPGRDGWPGDKGQKGEPGNILLHLHLRADVSFCRFIFNLLLCGTVKMH